MSEPTIRIYKQTPLEKLPTYIGECCREWVLVVGVLPGRCGICREIPTYKREDDDRHVD